MKLTKQTVYLPVSDFNSSERAICTIGIPDLYGDKVIEKQGYFFTPEQLNEYTRNVGKTFLEVGAQKAVTKNEWEGNTGSEYCDTVVDKQSITNTFDKTFNKFKV